jgi:hypothetical protein
MAVTSTRNVPSPQTLFAPRAVVAGDVRPAMAIGTDRGPAIQDGCRRDIRTRYPGAVDRHRAGMAQVSADEPTTAASRPGLPRA